MTSWAVPNEQKMAKLSKPYSIPFMWIKTNCMIMMSTRPSTKIMNSCPLGWGLAQGRGQYNMDNILSFLLYFHSRGR